MKKISVKSIIIILIAVGIISAAVYFFLIKPQQSPKPSVVTPSPTIPKTNSSTTVKSSNSSSATSSGGCPNYLSISSFDRYNPISQGMHGVQVEQLQNYMNKTFFEPANKKLLTVDGCWGPGTQTAFVNGQFIGSDGTIATNLTYDIYTLYNINNY